MGQGKTQKLSLAVCAAAASVMLMTDVASAQIDEIIVYARKRAESDLTSPVTMTTLSDAQLDAYEINSTFDLADIVPSLQVGGAGSVNGGTVVLRGISTGSENSTSDTSILINIDGVSVSRGGALRLGTFDMQQVSVLKGPQALFFGKNTSGGILSYQTAGPTDEL